MIALEKMKEYYEKGMWSLKMIRELVIKEKITSEDFEIITGEEYHTEEQQE